jgi:hypothetical protein
MLLVELWLQLIDRFTDPLTAESGPAVDPHG